MKIEELTQKIYEEGVEKAKQQEEELLEKGRKEAEQIVAEARQQAEQIVEKARKEAEQSKMRLDAELKLAGDQAVSQVKNRIVDCLLETSLPQSVESALSDNEFVKKLVLEIVERWDSSRTNLDLEVVLSSKSRDALGDYFAKRSKELLDRGLEVSFSEELKNGFQIRPRDGSYRISFEEDDFVSFFREFLRERTREILFPSDAEGPAGSSAGETGQDR